MKAIGVNEPMESVWSRRGVGGGGVGGEPKESGGWVWILGIIRASHEWLIVSSWSICLILPLTFLLLLGTGGIRTAARWRGRSSLFRLSLVLLYLPTSQWNYFFFFTLDEEEEDEEDDEDRLLLLLFLYHEISTSIFSGQGNHFSWKYIKMYQWPFRPHNRHSSFGWGPLGFLGWPAISTLTLCSLISLPFMPSTALRTDSSESKTYLNDSFTMKA